MINRIDFKGYYIDQCGLEGEGKTAGCVPAQHNTIRLSKNRWFLIFETRGFRGADDNRSVVYQVRKDEPTGEILSEGCLDKAVQQWDPLGDGGDFVKLCNHSVAFGVPKGAVINGRKAAHGGCFCAAWRSNARVLDRERDFLFHESSRQIPAETYRCNWIQFRLNDEETDIEITQQSMPLREKGYETGEALCRHEQFVTMNQGYVVPVPYNSERTEWVYLLHWGAGMHEYSSTSTAIRFAWNDDEKRYDWVETGPILRGPGQTGIFEGGIAPYRDDWLVSARITPTRYAGNAWFRMNDLFSEEPRVVFSRDVRSCCPRTTYTFPDGVVRVFTTDQEHSPYRHVSDIRCPLYALDIDPDNDFAVTSRRIVIDSMRQGIPIPLSAAPTNHFCRLVPHDGGDRGLLTYFVRPRSLKHPRFAGRYKGLLRDSELLASGVYCSEITYDDAYPAMWEF